MIFGRNINKYYIKYWYCFLIGISALVAVNYFQLLLPQTTGNIIDGLGENTLTPDLLQGYLNTLLIVLAVMFFGRFLWRTCIFGVSCRIETRIRQDMFYHAEKLSNRYFNENKTGALMALFTNDLSTVREAFGFGIVMLVDATVLGTLSFTFMFRLNWVLTLLSAVPLVALAASGGIIGKFMDAKWDERQKAFEDLSDFTQENFSGISVIKAFVKEGLELHAFRKVNKDNVVKNVAFVRYSTLLDICVSIFISSIGAIILGYGGYIVFKGELTVGELSAFFAYFGTLTWPMMAIAQLINLRSQASASLKRLDTLLNERVEILDHMVVDHKIEGKITFKNFSYRYPGALVDAIKDVNLDIEKGTMVGIIGKTGSGKTTLVNSLLRIFNVDNNKILIDDIDIMDLSYKNVRDAIGYVPQDNFLFSDTVYNNVGFSGDYSKEDIENATKFSDVHGNIIDFKDQYETMVGERGVTLSGGQKQRISIARAVIKNPEILILDDSVSAVDTKTEEIIIGNIKKERKGKTTILIAHRISTVKDLDKILLIDEGKVVAYGSHEELIDSCTQYQEMFNLQKLEDEVEQ